MGKITEQQFIKSIKENKFKTVYMLYGQEKYMLEGCAKMLYKQAVTEQQLLNFIKINGSKTTPEQIAGEVEALPVMSERRCVVVEDMQLDKLGKNQIKTLKEMMAELPNSTVLVFIFNAIQVDAKRSAVYRNFIDAVAKHGDAVEFKFKNKSDLVKLLTRQAAKKGGKLSDQAARELLERVGTDLNPLLGELDKLIAFSGAKEVNAEDVKLLAARSLDSSAFDLAKAVLQNRHREAMLLLNELMMQRQDEISILAALNMSFMDMYRAKCAQLAGKTEAVITSAYQYRGKEFRIRNAMRDCGRFSMNQIRSCIEALADADLKIKSSRVDKRIILETALGKMIVYGGIS